MKIIKLNMADAGEPRPGWTRLGLAQAEHFSIGYFYRSEGHTSPQHHHPAEQVSIVIQGHLKVAGNDGAESIIGPGESVYFSPNERHRVEQSGTGQAIGIDIFAPARNCDLWMNQ